MQEHIKNQMGKRSEASTFRAGVASTGNGRGGQSSEKPHGPVDVKINLVTCKAYAPPHSVLFHCTTSHRVRGYYCLEGRPSKGCLLALGQDTACRVVLDWLWSMHRKAYPMAEVPFTFPLEGDVVPPAPSAPKVKAKRKSKSDAASSSSARAPSSAPAPPSAPASSSSAPAPVQEPASSSKAPAPSSIAPPPSESATVPSEPSAMKRLAPEGKSKPRTLKLSKTRPAPQVEPAPSPPPPSSPGKSSSSSSSSS